MPHESKLKQHVDDAIHRLRPSSDPEMAVFLILTRIPSLQAALDDGPAYAVGPQSLGCIVSTPPTGPLAIVGRPVAMLRKSNIS
ncbi:hypothetical protein H2202_003979 [Exophiala xenobiotica]|nr:hypothetical protein H2202_003979 [Exophiala xenobiotica]